MTRMTFKEKFLFIFLQIITIGLIWIYWNQQKQKLGQENELSYATKTNFEINKLINLIGEKENILEISNTHTKVKISFKDRTKINAEAIKNLKGVSGIFFNDQTITIIVGNEAKIINELITKTITINN